MKASAFSYARATSVSNALELLHAHGDRAKVLSGGQSLMPAMNLRLISPELIVDIGELTELRGIAVTTATPRSTCSAVGSESGLLIMKTVGATPKGKEWSRLATPRVT